jgi:hypothetical protein
MLRVALSFSDLHCKIGIARQNAMVTVAPPGCGNFTMTNPGLASNCHATLAAANAAAEAASFRAAPSRRTAAGRAAWILKTIARALGEFTVTIVDTASATHVIVVPSKIVKLELPAG